MHTKKHVWSVFVCVSTTNPIDTLGYCYCNGEKGGGVDPRVMELCPIAGRLCHLMGHNERRGQQQQQSTGWWRLALN